MSDSLGKLVYELEARIANFESDLGRATRIAQKEARAAQKAYEDSFRKIEESARRGAEGILDGFSALTGLNPASLGIAAIAAGFGEVTKKAIETGDALNKMSQKTGVGVDALSGIAFAADLSDVSLQDLGGSLAKFAKTSAEAAGGSKEQAAAFAAMGVSVKAADGSIRPMEDLLGDVATQFAGYRDGVEKTALAQALFGKSGASMIPLLNTGREGLRSASAEAKALGYNFGDIAGKSEEFNDNLTRMGKAAVGFGADIARQLLPPLIEGEKKILDFIKAARESGYLQDLAKALGVVAENADKLAIIIGARLGLSVLASGATLAAGAISGMAASTTLAAGSFMLVGKNIDYVKGGLGIFTAAVAGWQFGKYLEENFLEAKLAGIALVDGVLSSWESMKSNSEVIWLTIVDTITKSINTARTRIADLLDSYAKFAQTDLFTGKQQENTWATALAASIRPAADAAGDLAGKIAAAKAAGESAVAGVHAITGEMADYAIKTFAAGDASKKTGEAITGAGDAGKKAAPNVAGLGAAGDAASKALAKLSEMFAKDAEDLAALQGQLGPVSKAYQEYAKTVQAAQKNYADEIAQADAGHAALDAYARIKQTVIDKTAGAQRALKAETDAWAKQNDVVGDYLKKIGEESKLIGLSDREREITQALQEQIDAWKKLDPEMQRNNIAIGELDPTSKKGADAIRDVTGALHDQKEAFAASESVSREWVSTWTSAASSVADAFAKMVVDGGHFMDDLKDIAKQVVQSIISQFAKLAVINPILNSIFGMSAGGGSFLPTLASAAGSAFSGGSGGGTAGAAMSFATDGAGGGNSIMSAGTWVGLGQKLYSGFSSGFSNLGSMAGNFWNGTSGSIQQVGGYGVNMPGAGSAGYSGAYGGYGSGFGQALGVAGAVYAGYNRFQNSNKDAAGALGGAAYGVGTYAVGAGLASAAAGTGFAAGVGGAVAIPVVGWIAAIAMVVDMISGGKLFGTGKQMKGGWAEMSTSATGGAAQNFIDFKGQSAFFGGAEFTQEQKAASAEQLAAAQAFFDAIKKGSTDFGKQFGLDAGEVAAGIFSQKFDKKGNPTGETITHINGLDYHGETQEQFGQRIQAESFTLDLAKIGVDITAYTHQFIQDADAYAQAVQESASVALGAQADIKAGMDYLAISGDDTIQSIYALAEASMGYGESIAQAYQRIQSAQAQYWQFTGQFKPPATFVDDFEASLSGINTQMLANIKQANDLAIAAGAEGAATKDLVNIHAYAAKQFAAALQQLETSAQANAYGLGLAPAGTLDQINNQIALLEGHANGAASATAGFGAAMQQASQQASDAINLLLGDLSPLNDQQKLQTALQGLYAGTVTQEQVLQIGRRLYATGQQYTDLFNTVSRAGRVAMTGGGGQAAYGGGTSASHAAYDPTGSGDHRTLAELYAARDEALAQQQYAGAQTLAQQIAEIAMAKGEDFEQVLAEMKIKDTDLAQALHLDNVDQLKQYMDQRQAEIDSAGENTASIVDAINRLGDRLTGTVNRDDDRRYGGDRGAGIRPDPGHNDLVIESIERTGADVRALVRRLDQGGIGGTSAPRGGLRLPAPVR